MATHYRTQGFILKKVDRGEADRVFTVFSKDHGKLDLLARAERKIKSKLRGGLELFYLSELEFIQGKTQKTLTDAALLDNFKRLRGDLGRLGIVSRISEVLDRTVKGQEPDDGIWQLLEEVFGKLGDRAFKISHLSLVYYYFLWNLLSLLGYQPELYSCPLCQKKIRPGSLFFSAKEGGLLCRDCQGRVKGKKSLLPETVKVIRLLLKRDWPTLRRLKLERDNIKDLKAISAYFFRSVLRQIE